MQAFILKVFSNLFLISLFCSVKLQKRTPLRSSTLVVGGGGVWVGVGGEVGMGKGKPLEKFRKGRGNPCSSVTRVFK